MLNVPIMSRFYFLLLCISVSEIFAATDFLNAKCELENGKSGICVHLRDCPSSTELVKRRGQPNICSFDKLESIICCERASNQTNDSMITMKLKRRNIGAIAEEKCNETHMDEFRTLRRFNYTTLVNLEGEIERVPFGYGGVYSAARDYKHMAVLGFGGDGNTVNKWLCGGSLISKSFVMTAAHCVTSQLGPVKMVRLGDLNINRTDDDAEPQDYRVVRVIIHPQYRPPAVYHDIALIELDGEAKTTHWVQPGCLHTDISTLYPNWRATGWGVTSFDGDQADHLQVVFLEPFKWESCQNAYGQTSKKRLPNGIDNATQICAGHPKMDTCQGDSGGPLQTVNRYFLSGYTIIGVTTFGKACGLSKSPGVYTRVSYYLDWIESVVWPEEYKLSLI